MPMTMSDTQRRDRHTFEQFAATRRYQPALSFSPDGSEIAYSTNTSGQFNLWRQSSDGGYPHQLTTFTERAVRSIAWSPDGETILFTADLHGDEFQQLFRVPARGGRPEQLTDAPQVRHQIGAEPWSPDGSTILYNGNDRTPTDQDVLAMDAGTGEVRRVMHAGGLLVGLSWSPDGGTITVVDFKSNTSQDAYLLDAESGEAEHLTPRDEDLRFFPGPWAADGSGFYVLTDEGREYTGLAFYDLGKASYRWLETPEWEIEQVVASKDGRYLAWTVNDDGYSRLYVRDLSTGKLERLPEIPVGAIQSLTMSPDGRRIGMLLHLATLPPEIYVVNLDSHVATRLTYGFLGGIDEDEMVEPEIVRYTTHDGREIPAFLYRPRGAGPFGVVLSIHGGPESQERPAYAYNGLYQYWLSRGIGVLAPNVRGSTGYGKTYQKLIHRDWGGAELKDFECAVHYLHTLDWVDPQRIGVFGGSFGGFATLSCVSRLPDYWAAAVDIVGPSNLVTFAKAVPPTWRRFMTQWVGDPETEVDFLMERSPITYVEQIKAPLFIIQGANDPRVVKPESDQIVEKLRSLGVDVRYDVYEDEGHGFTKRENELRALKDVAEFMERYLARE